MKRKLLIGLFAFGTVAGYGSTFACFKHRHEHRRAHFERHVAQVCVEAAREADRAEPAPPPPPERRRHHRRHPRHRR